MTANTSDSRCCLRAAFASHLALLKPVVLLVFAILLMSCRTREVPAGNRQVEFRGSVEAGEIFEHRFAEKHRFVLDPTEFGWTIRIFEEGREEDLSRLTPPLHFVPNPREIEGWHFRNKLNTGPNSEKLAEAVNAPRHEREFIFSPEVGRTIQGPEAKFSPSPSEIDRIKSFAHGVLTITDLKLTPPKHGEQAKILKMSFRCVISLSTRIRSDNSVGVMLQEWGEDVAFSTSYDKEHPVYKQLQELGTAAVTGLIQAIAESQAERGHNDWIRDNAAFLAREILVGAEPADFQEVVPELIALLHSTNVAVRQWGASLLDSIGPVANAAEADLFPLLSDRSTRKQAALALTRIGGDSARLVPELIPLLEDFDAEVSRTGMFCLECLGPQASSAEPALLPFLQSTNVTLRAAAASAIRAINPNKTQFVEDALEAAKREDQRRFEARFRADSGLYCEAVPETNSVEQGTPLNVSISFFARPAELPPGVKNLNTFWMREFLRLHLTNQDTGRAFILNLEEFYDIGISEDNLSRIEPLDGRRIGPWKMEFRLVRLRDELAPGRYTCAIEFAYPKGPHKYWRLHPDRSPREWEKFGFWSGRIFSAPFALEIREEQPRQMELVRPKSPRLERADDGTYQLVFKKGDVEKVVREVHNGFVLGERIENPDNTSSLASGTSDWAREDSILKIPPGKKRVRFRATVFETSEMPDHFWQPQRGIYNVLWEVNLQTNLKEVISAAK